MLCREKKPKWDGDDQGEHEAAGYYSSSLPTEARVLPNQQPHYLQMRTEMIMRLFWLVMQMSQLHGTET